MDSNVPLVLLRHLTQHQSPSFACAHDNIVCPINSLFVGACCIARYSCSHLRRSLERDLLLSLSLERDRSLLRDLERPILLLYI